MRSCKKQGEELKVVAQQFEELRRQIPSINKLDKRNTTLQHQIETFTATLCTYEELEARVRQWALATQQAHEGDWRAEEANRPYVSLFSVEMITTGGPSNRDLEDGLSRDQMARQAEHQALLVRVQSTSALDNSALNKRVAELSVIEAEYRDVEARVPSFNEAQERNATAWLDPETTEVVVRTNKHISKTNEVDLHVEGDEMMKRTRLVV